MKILLITPLCWITLYLLICIVLKKRKMFEEEDKDQDKLIFQTGCLLATAIWLAIIANLI